jgi:hypothetical protein
LVRSQSLAQKQLPYLPTLLFVIMNDSPENKDSNLSRKELIKIECEEIKKLIPPKGVSIEERSCLNKTIREKLPLADIVTLGYLYACHNHDLSAGEIERRLNSGVESDLEGLLALQLQMSDIPAEHWVAKRLTRLREKIHENIVKHAKNYAQQEIIYCAETYRSTILERTRVFEHIIGYREDQDEIVKTLRSHGVYSHLDRLDKDKLDYYRAEYKRLSLK